MKALILYTHSWDKSFNHAILESIIKGLEKKAVTYEIIDLLKDGFNPVMTEKDLAAYGKGTYADPKVGEYQKKIDTAEELYIITPIWWGLPPATLKGFFDKVLLNHWAYESTPSGLLKGKLKHIKRCTVVSTMNSPHFYYNLFLKSPLKNAVINGTLKTCGIKNIKWLSFARVLTVKDKVRAQWLRKVEELASK